MCEKYKNAGGKWDRTVFGGGSLFRKWEKTLHFVVVKLKVDCTFFHARLIFRIVMNASIQYN